jgi:hypothetical protein
MASVLKVDKLDPQSGTALEIGTSGDTITVPSGATFVVAGTTEITGTNNVQRPNAAPIIINGNMAVSQRSTSVASITSSGYNTVDRWEVRAGNGGTWTQTQDTDVPSGYGFKTALKMDCTTADASLGASDLLGLRYQMEAQDCQVFDWGTNARAITVAFWVKATKTGTNILELFQTDASRVCCQAYTIDTTDTWEFKVLNFPADTSGSANDDNGSGLQVRFWMAAGTDWTSGTLATTWEGNTDANRAVGQVNNADSTSNNFAITAIQLEAGEYTSSTIPPFQHESYGDNLARCQRYFYKTSAVANMPFASGVVNGTTNARAYLTYPQIMRATPTMARSGDADFKVYCGGTNIDSTSVGFYYGNTQQVLLYVNVASGLTDGEGCMIIDDSGANAYITGASEL